MRRYRYPVSGTQLAQELGISLRTLYRDIQTLKEQGAVIDGEAGVGFILRPGFTLPPMMLTQQEIEALVLGSRWVADRADSQLAQAARDIIAKVAAVLPAQLRHELESSALLIGPGELIAAGDAELISIRRAINAECKIEITYLDVNGEQTGRIIWPFALGFFDRARVLLAWCELRQDTRHFRTDRIAQLAVLDERYPRRRQAMLKEWRQKQRVEDRNFG